MQNGELVLNVLKIFGLGAASFFFSMVIAPAFIRLLRIYQAWSPTLRSKALTGEDAEVVRTQEERKEEAPRLGGLLVWGTVFTFTIIFWILAEVFGSPLLEKLNFLSRNQTWLPLFTLTIAGVIGLIDDLLRIHERGGYVAGGLALRKRILLVIIIGFIGAFWFYDRLDQNTIIIPFLGEITLGVLYIPFFILVMLSTFSSGIIDGVDGLSGGVFSSIFGAYLAIAFFQGQNDLAAFLSVVIGALLAFLWYNIPPAKFYLGETGILALTTMLTVVAFLTNAVAVLPIIGLLLVVTSGSAILQIFWKRVLHRKLFIAAPLHHHLEAKGWTRPQITMRYWIMSTVVALIGMIVAIIG